MRIRATAAVIAACALFATTACGGTPAQQAPVPSAPSPEQQLLTQAHSEQWPATDDKIIQLAHQQCPAAGHPAGATDLAVSFVVLDTNFTMAQAKSFVYTARRLFCPDTLGS